jgi:membrane protease YdiL (CAAX protease family)
MPGQPINEQVLPDLAARGLLALTSAAFGGGLWLWLRPGHRRLFPPQRLRAVSWTGRDVAALLFLSLIFWPVSVQSLLDQLGFFGWMYGGASPDRDQESLWIGLFSVPLNIATVLAWMRLGRGIRFYQLGLTCHRGLENALLATIAWFITTPLVYLLGFLADFGSARLLHVPPDKHPLFELATSGPMPAELAAIVFAAIVAAPVWEELLFRGVLQRWFTVTPWGSNAAVAGALAIAFLDRGSKGPWPVLFVLAMIPGYVFVSRTRSRPLPSADAARAIFATALLFAAFHARVWPTPVPLFALGLVLGFLAYRTQSLIAPILLHGLFNNVATMAILYALFVSSEPQNGKEATTALRAAPATAISADVPGSWLPRRTYAKPITAPTDGDQADEVTCPISLPSRRTFDLDGKGEAPSALRPTSDRLTWP